MIATGTQLQTPGFQDPFEPDGGGFSPGTPGAAWPPPSDRIASPYAPPAAPPPQAQDPSGEPATSAATGELASFMSTIEGLFGQLASLVAGLLGSTNATASTAKPAFTNATLSSNGDPHDAFSGTTSAGASENAKWDDAASHGNLITSDSFAGGYRVATTVTGPNARGSTMNESATVTTSGGNTSVRLDEDGSYSVTSGGNAISLATGVSTSLGNGESVTREGDGSLIVAMQNAAGGSIVTTLRTNGDGGVDVGAQAANVDLGGYLAAHATQPAAPAPQPVRTWPVRE